MGEVRISAGSAASAVSLTGWLRRDPGVARSGVEIASAGLSQPQSPPGAMGTLETVTALVDSSVGLLGPLVSVAAWRRPQGAPPPAVRVTETNGSVLEGTAEDVLSVLQARRERDLTRGQGADRRQALEQDDV